MAETGWPLIPREVLPAPVPPAARNRRPQRAAQPDAGRQLSIFGAETTEPSPLDLAGLVAGPGRLDRMGGTARVAVTVDSAWRVHVLVSELVSRGLVVHWRPLQIEVQDQNPSQTQDEIRRVPPPPESGAYPHAGSNGANPAPPPGPAASSHRPYRPDDADESVSRGLSARPAADPARFAVDPDGVHVAEDFGGPDGVDFADVTADGIDFADFTGDPALEDGGGVIGGRGGRSRDGVSPAVGDRDGAGRDDDGRARAGRNGAIRDSDGWAHSGRGSAGRDSDGWAHSGRGAAGRDGDGWAHSGRGSAGRDGDGPAPGGRGDADQDGDGSARGGQDDAVRDGGPEPDQPARVLFEVRTAYSSRLNGLARAWPEAADQLFLGGPRLRLWVAAAGRPIDGGYALGLGEHDPATWPAVDAALRRAGLDGVLSDHGLDYLIMGRKRLARLAELVGERPDAAPAELWPGGPAA